MGASTAQRAAFVLATLGALAYVLAAIVMRLWRAFDPYVAETDWKQWVWQYHRYYVDGAFPEGHLLTDYAFTVQPPVFWAAMAGLSSLMEPVIAANVLNVVALLLTFAAVYWAVSQRTNHYVGLAAMMLMAREGVFFRITAGGYPRSFGPALTLLFLAVWLTGRHRLTCATLILVAALYPSVAVPACLAYGAWTLVAPPREGRVRRILELGATGAVVACLGLLQSLQAPDWWGAVVSYEEALKMPSLGRQGRTPWVPHGDLWKVTLRYLLQPFSVSGHLLLDEVTKWNAQHKHVLLVVPAAFAALVLVVRRQRFPAQLPLFLLCGFLSYVLARVLAFKLYLPHRMVQHSLPYLVIATLPVLYFYAFRALLPTKRWAATVLTIAVGIAPVFLVSGDGLAIGHGYRRYGKDRQLYEWIERNTPVDAQFAGNLQPLDEIPFFSARQVYVNWKMAHPFRKGFFAEIERRVLRMYDAYYATDLDTVVTFAEEEAIDYFVVDKTRYSKLERGDGQLFEPLRTKVKPMFERGRSASFVLAQPPEEAVVFRHRVYTVIDMAKLRKVAERRRSDGSTSAGASGNDDGAPAPSLE